MPPLLADTYLTRWFTAEMIQQGHVQSAIGAMLAQGFVIQASHTVRNAEGNDVLLIIFEKAPVDPPANNYRGLL